MKTILIGGGGGQVGRELGRIRWPCDVTILRPDRVELDLADEGALTSWFAAHPVDAVINAAAYTAVDRAEQEVAAAFRGNAQVSAALADHSRMMGIPLIHLSTDYVFDGTKHAPYVETDRVGPLGVYGASKLAGELAVQAGNPRSVIVRTAWVLSAHRTNFLKTMLHLGSEHAELRVVADQLGCPTGAADVANAVAVIAHRMITDPTAPVGTYHFVNQGDATWCDLAREIFRSSARRGGPSPHVIPIPTADFLTAARRPANSRLSSARIQTDYAVTPRPWRDMVDEIVSEVLSREGTQS